MERILIIEDEDQVRRVLAQMLERENYNVLEASDGEEGLDICRKESLDLVITDLLMPEKSGIDVIQEMKGDESLMHIPIIVVSAMNEIDRVSFCIEQGADDYMVKPYNRTLLNARVKSSLRKKTFHDQEEAHRKMIEEFNASLKEQVREQVREISSVQLGMIFAMSKLAESRDEETGEHLERMQVYSMRIAEELQKSPKYKAIIDDDFISNMFIASPLHDIGKVGIPDAILLKPGPLTDEEFAIMKTHTSIGANTLREVEEQNPNNAFIQMGIEIAESHHEKWDGGGYPCGQKGEEIPISARIVCIGDVYDALTSKRCYKKAFTHEKSKEIILEGRGTHFDPDVVDAFIALEQEFIKIRKTFVDTEF